jgi:RHS repeat-associated protein
MLATDSQGNTSWKAVAEAFGATGALPESTITMNLRFPGQYFDEESGDHYNFMRIYKPCTGRYGQSDPIGLYGGINLFAYADNNPIGSIDSRGEIAPVVAGALIVGGCLWTAWQGYQAGVEYAVSEIRNRRERERQQSARDNQSEGEETTEFNTFSRPLSVATDKLENGLNTYGYIPVKAVAGIAVMGTGGGILGAAIGFACGSIGFYYGQR